MLEEWREAPCAGLTTRRDFDRGIVVVLPSTTPVHSRRPLALPSLLPEALRPPSSTLRSVLPTLLLNHILGSISASTPACHNMGSGTSYAGERGSTPRRGDRSAKILCAEVSRVFIGGNLGVEADAS